MKQSAQQRVRACECGHPDCWNRKIRRGRNLLSAGDDLANAAERVLRLNRNTGIPVEAILDELDDAIVEWRKRRE